LPSRVVQSAVRRAVCEHVFVRWENLTTEKDERARLPGYSRPAVVRHFDAPEALDMRFYEVQAKSALNRVPDRSAVPFRWTINPYRGCSHACVYCAAGDTPILMADGRTMPLRELAVGDRIVGTHGSGTHRRYAETEVLAHWSSIKPAWRVTLQDGTELVTSGEHRFLSQAGWKHVTGGGREGRPHLTSADALLGTGGFAVRPRETAEYRRGYLCGVLRGDGAVAPRDRTCRYLGLEGVAAVESRSCTQSASRREVCELTAWPRSPGDDWRKGFLAGIFDADGWADREALRIANRDRVVAGWVRASLLHLGFACAEEVAADRGGPWRLRVGGGLRERLRFLHLCDPANMSTRTVQGLAVESGAGTGVVSVEPLGVAMRLFDITTGTGDFIADGVVSHNCFARPTHRYLDLDAGRDFERQIVVKVNVPEVLRRELARPSWAFEHVAMGTNTDPYQWVEGRYKLMRGIWEALRDARNPCSILTKSPLVLRDVDLLREIAEVADVSASFSVPTLDQKAWRETEPHTPHPRARLEAVGELNRAGIPTGILVAPLMPGINDDPRQVEAILEAAREAGAVSIGGIALHMRGEVRDVFMGWLRDARPDLVERYERLYAGGAYADRGERARLARLVARSGPPGDGGFRMRAPQRRTHAAARDTPATPAQGSLF
jgi:DNA repair photolyase